MDFSEWRDADFYSLASQATIHSLASLRTEKDTSKFLVSCMNCQFCSVEYQIGDKITPVMKAVQFSNLPMPGDAEVVAVSVFERLPPKQGHVVGITYVIFNKPTTPEQPESTVKSQAFNVYSAIVDQEDGGSSAGQLKLEVIAENCQGVSLMYIPYCLKTTVVQTQTGTTEPVFLISGSDNTVHMYREEPGDQPAIGEMISGNLFPEFKDLHSIAETIEIARPDPVHRVTAIGFQEGPIEVYQVNIHTLDIVKVWKTSMDGPITSLHFFTHRKLVPVPPCFDSYVDENGPGGRREEVENPAFTHLHLLMTVHLQPALVYRNVLHSGLSEALTLPDSDRFDSALCSVALDVDFDGEHEVIIGTYGQELLVYKFFPTVQKEVSVTGQSQGQTSTPPPTSSGRRLTVSGLSPSEEACKHRHRSEEGTAPDKAPQDQHRKVKSQEDLMGMLTREKGKDPAGKEGAGVGGREGLTGKVGVAGKEGVGVAGKEGVGVGGREGVVKEGVMGKVGVAGKEGVGVAGKEGAGVAGRVGREGGEGDREVRTVQEPHYRLQWRRAFPCPIVALGCGDMMGDGVDNLAVLTAFGIHILQPNTNKLMDLVTERLRQCVNAQNMADEFHKLQLE